MIAFFQQYGYVVQLFHSDHENTILSAQTLLNQQNIQLKTIAPYQHERILERYVQTINARFRSVTQQVILPPSYSREQRWTLMSKKWSHSAHMPRYTMP